ncbi:hypothetical protein MTO96_008343 [Rhipicephalus appendiculatus]
MRAVVSVLENNQCLRTLSMEGVSLDDVDGLDQLPEALSKNCNLHFLCIAGSTIPMSKVSALCKALCVNKCLKTLKLPGVRGTEEEKTSLARQLLEDKCYDRVELGRWTEPYLRILAPVLASSQACTTELSLLDIGELSQDSASVLFKTLAFNKKVKRLTVIVQRNSDQRVVLLCEMLEKNTSIDYLWINIENENAAAAILRALTANTGISHLQIYFMASPLEETTAAFTSMLLRNKAITSISGHILVVVPRQFMEAFT